MINLSATYTNTPVADGALDIAANRNPNFSTAQTRNMPVEPQTPNRVSSPEQVASALKNQPSATQASPSATTGSLLDVRA